MAACAACGRMPCATVCGRMPCGASHRCCHSWSDAMWLVSLVLLLTAVCHMAHHAAASACGRMSCGASRWCHCSRQDIAWCIVLVPPLTAGCHVAHRTSADACGRRPHSMVLCGARKQQHWRDALHSLLPRAVVLAQCAMWHPAASSGTPLSGKKLNTERKCELHLFQSVVEREFRQDCSTVPEGQ